MVLGENGSIHGNLERFDPGVPLPDVLNTSMNTQVSSHVTLQQPSKKRLREERHENTGVAQKARTSNMNASSAVSKRRARFSTGMIIENCRIRDKNKSDIPFLDLRKVRRLSTSLTPLKVQIEMCNRKNATLVHPHLRVTM